MRTDFWNVAGLVRGDQVYARATRETWQFITATRTLSRQCRCR